MDSLEVTLSFILLFLVVLSLVEGSIFYGLFYFAGFLVLVWDLLTRKF